MSLYGNNWWTSILSWKKLKQYQSPGVFFFKKDSKEDPPESASRIHFEFNPSRPNAGRREKIKLSFYFHTSLLVPQKVFWRLLRPS